jgi:hypothetical protein
MLGIHEDARSLAGQERLFVDQRPLEYLFALTDLQVYLEELVAGLALDLPVSHTMQGIGGVRWVGQRTFGKRHML